MNACGQTCNVRVEFVDWSMYASENSGKDSQVWRASRLLTQRDESSGAVGRAAQRSVPACPPLTRSYRAFREHRTARPCLFRDCLRPISSILYGCKLKFDFHKFKSFRNELVRAATVVRCQRT